MAISIIISITEERKLVLHIFARVLTEDWKAVNTEAEMMKNRSYLEEESSSSVTRGTSGGISVLSDMYMP